MGEWEKGSGEKLNGGKRRRRKTDLQYDLLIQVFHPDDACAEALSVRAERLGKMSMVLEVRLRRMLRIILKVRL